MKNDNYAPPKLDTFVEAHTANIDEPPEELPFENNPLEKTPPQRNPQKIILPGDKPSERSKPIDESTIAEPPLRGT